MGAKSGERFLSERRHAMRRILVLALGLLFLTCGCSRIKSRYDAVKERIKEAIDAPFRTDFYSDYGAWDYYRVPLIAP